MARVLTGTGRITVFPLLHVWPGECCVLAYTTTGNFADTAVIGYVPVPGIGNVSLWNIAARHLTPGESKADMANAQADWLVGLGRSSRSVPKLGSLEFLNTEWSLEVDRVAKPKQAKHGHDGVQTGRFALEDPALMDQVRSLMPATKKFVSAA